MAGSIKLAAPLGGSVTLNAVDTASNFVMTVPAAAGVLINADSATGAAQLPVGTTGQRPGTPATGQTRYNSTTNNLEIYASGAWGPINSYASDVLVVAGGGGGGSDAGGGGGAGGLLASSQTLTIGSSYTVTIGAGGIAGTGGNTPVYPTNNAGSGSNSVFSGGSITTQTAIGGGYGGMGESRGIATGSGGSGGGGGGTYPNNNQQGPAGTATSGQGNVGSAGLTTPECGGGGGGAGAAATNQNGGVGSNWQSLGTFYAGGGGGGAYSGGAGHLAGAGGNGGGGNGGGYPGNTAAVGSAGTTNTGGGGGGGTQLSGAAGGSGIVIVRYVGSQRGTGGTVTSSGGYTYHTFTTSGTYTA